MKGINKVILIMVCLIVIIGAIATAMILSGKNKKNINYNEETKIAEEILDECTDEYEEMQKSDIIQTNFEEEKISPNCQITLKKYYKKCKDEINEYLTVDENLVNKTKEDLQEEYEDWEIKSFSSNQIVLYKEFDGECGEHFILKDDDGKIAIYKILENGEEELYETTEISTDYLTGLDNMDIQNGLRVNGLEKLNELIENFE